MRAHAAASAVRVHGSATPSTHTAGPDPNIDTRSAVSKLRSGNVADGKFGNAQPFN
jgi:hypothetical protein